MAIDLTTPTVRPPSSLDALDEDPLKASTGTQSQPAPRMFDPEATAQIITDFAPGTSQEYVNANPDTVGGGGLEPPKTGFGMALGGLEPPKTGFDMAYAQGTSREYMNANPDEAGGLEGQTDNAAYWLKRTPQVSPPPGGGGVPRADVENPNLPALDYGPNAQQQLTWDGTGGPGLSLTGDNSASDEWSRRQREWEASGGGGNPGGAGSLDAPLIDFAQGALDAPSRWDSDMVRQGIELVNNEMTRSGERATSAQDEFYSGRGLVGSSVESQGRTDLLSQLEQQKGQRLFDLQREMANTFATDRTAAGNIGLGTAQFEEGKKQFDTQVSLSRRAQELQELGMDRDEAYRYASLEQQGGQFGQNLAQRESEFSRQFGLSGEELDLRAEEIRTQAGLEGRSLSIAEARQEAEVAQFESSMNFERDRFAQEMGLSRDQLTQQATQFQATLQDSRDARADRLGLQQDSQEFQAIQNGFDRVLERDALQLQRDGLDAETAWRTADRDLEDRIATEAQRLEAQGLSQQQAYQQAVITLDAQQMQQSADIANQQAELSAHDIYLRALAAGAGDEMPYNYATTDPNDRHTLPTPTYGEVGGGSGEVPQWILDLFGGQGPTPPKDPGEFVPQQPFTPGGFGS